jgi:cobaltochelatase CobN
LRAVKQSEGSKRFFFEKKKQKTFGLHTGFCNGIGANARYGSLPPPAPPPTKNKSFLLLFFKKEVLPSLLPHRPLTMHILFREQRHLDEDATAVDLGQTPADLVLLSFSDADLGAAAMAWRALPEPRPTLRLANLSQLRHPLSVDLYIEQVLQGAKTIIIRLLGGLDYWRYGCEEVFALCQAQGKQLAILSGDGADDARLRDVSTLAAPARAALDAYFTAGGPENFAQALRLMASLAGLGPPPTQPPIPLPRCGEHKLAGTRAANDTAPLAALVFYRSHLLAGDIAPIEHMAQALEQRGLHCRALFADSLKAPETAAFISATLRQWQPAVVLNATGFSTRGASDAPSPLDAANAPVLQLILAASTREAWEKSPRGLSPADMAMQIVLPERDGRLSTSAISFKTPTERIAELEFAQTIHKAAPAQIALAADRVLGWVRLAKTVPAQRRLALILSDYPGPSGAEGQIGHATGLDSFASTDTIAALLREHGYTIPPRTAATALRDLPPTPFLSLADYSTLFAQLPQPVQAKIQATWGEPEHDPALRAGNFIQPHLRLGNLLLAIQPDRGAPSARKTSYHDPDLPPRHAYVAFYLWLRQAEQIHALIHLGAHGTLEWLPGKALAPAQACFPTALLAGLPVIYPFIVNNPGEAVVARRRLGAVVLGHLTPPLKSAGTHGAAVELERLLDEYATADGLDRRRTALLRQEILSRAEAAGLWEESGCPRGLPEDDALARLDAYLCDVKELQIRDGLHVYGHPPSLERRRLLLDAIHSATPGADPATLAQSLDASAPSERAALLAALNGNFIPPGPSGAPSRGRADVLPTGRNLYSLDPRTTPTRSAMLLADKTAETLLRRHLQDHGDWPRTLVIDLWGSTALRTGGEDLALALILMGATPIWDIGSSRICGIEILPLAQLGRPRVDVTLRISGLFRDAFESQIRLFDLAVQSLAARDEPDASNPLAACARNLQDDPLRRATTRIYGAAPGAYGAGATDFSADTIALGEAYLAAGAFAYSHGQEGVVDAAGFAARIRAADAFVHQQDHTETDLLDAPDFAAFEGGFAAAAQALGANPALYHADISRADAPRLRSLREEIARVVRGKAANPEWIAGMMRHDYRGAAEISRALEALYAFAATLPDRFDTQFDLIFDATIGNGEVDSFLRRANPAAHQTMLTRFRSAAERDFWRCRRNSVVERLAGGL